MFETLVTRLLTNALGNVIDPKCFSGDKINVAVWSGYVVLHELEIKPEVLDHPALRLVRGMVGSIELKIPWNRLQSDSVVATVDDVYLLVHTEADVEAVMRAMDEFTIKKKLLESLYLQAKQQDKDEEDDASENGFAARLINKIIDNVELHIRRIHVRIEDHHSGDHPFAVGLTIESVHVQSTNSNWQPSYVDTSVSNEPRIFKVVELNHLSVYLNPDCDVIHDHKIDFKACSLGEFSSAFSRSIPKRFDDRHFQQFQLYPPHQQHHFLLKPIDASARLIVNRDVSDSGMPRVEVDVSIPEVALRLEESQYCDLLYLVAALQVPDHYAKYQPYRKFRPSDSVFEARPGEWWNYAISAVMSDVRDKQRRWSWSYMSKRRTDRKKYVRLWVQRARRRLEQESGGTVFSDTEDELGERDDDVLGDSNDLDGTFQSPISEEDFPESQYELPELEKALEDIERHRTVEDILFFRFLGDAEVRKSGHFLRPRPTLAPPPMHNSAASDTESVDTEVTGSSAPTEEKFRTWGAWMFGWTSKLAVPPPTGQNDDVPQRVLPDVEMRELFKILEYEPAKRAKKRLHQKNRDDASDHGDEHSETDINELLRVTVSLQRGSLSLASDPETNRTLARDDGNYGRKYAPSDFLLGTFSQLQIAGVVRDDTVAFDLSLQSIEAFDESAESSLFSRLLSRKQTFRPGPDNDENSVGKLSGVVFLMSFETNPANSSADAALFVHMEPLEIVFSPTARCWGRLASFLDTPKALGLWAELEVASFNAIVNLKARTEAKLNYVLANRLAMSVDLRIQAPIIIIPESDTDYDCSRLIVDLGHINFRTDRLSQLDNDTINFNPASTASLGRSGLSSLALMTPGSPNISSSTSFVKQLYDEADRGEGAIRWKEEFYDKFNLSVTNVHVLLVPYGKTSQSNGGLYNQGGSYPSVALPQYYFDASDPDHENELVERFNINATVRTSILPLDATLTRFYIHADLPALTVNLSTEKYFLLMGLTSRFSAAGEAGSAATPSSGAGNIFTAEGGVGNVQDVPSSISEPYNTLTMANLRSFMLDDDGQVFLPTVTGLTHDNISDGDSSVESDETWFSITSGSAEMGAAAPETRANGEGDLLLSDLSGPSSLRVDDEGQMRSGRGLRRPSRRTNVPSSKRELLDRRICVCTITIPLISIKVKKPQPQTFTPFASFGLDETGVADDGMTENGTILVKLQGFRARVGQKTLSTQASLSLMSLEVEDSVDETDRTAQYLVFSCPTIEAPFSIRNPPRRGGNKASMYTNPRVRPRRQRERVISLRRGDPTASPSGSRRAGVAPEYLLELSYSSMNDEKTGREVLRDLDVQVGSIQVIFDQTYVCSLFELFEEASVQVAIVPASTRHYSVADGTTDDNLPPLELSPTIEQEYKLPVTLTDSVRADLERARLDLLQNGNGNQAKQPPLPALAALKVNAHIHSVSICFSDRGEPVASVAILRSECQLSTTPRDEMKLTGAIGDIKVFDLSSGAKDGELGISSYARNRETATTSEYREIFGQSLRLIEDAASDVPTGLITFDCFFLQNGAAEDRFVAESDGIVDRKLPGKSKIAVSVHPARLVVQPDFIESVAVYLLDGSMRSLFLARQSERVANLSDDKSESEASINDVQFGSPPTEREFAPESSTPFFEAVEALSKSNDEARPLERHSRPKVVPRNDNVGRDSVGPAAQPAVPEQFDYEDILTQLDFEIKLIHPSIAFPSFSLESSSVMGGRQSGIVVDFGVISGTTNDSGLSSGNESAFGINVHVADIGVSSLSFGMPILEPFGFGVQLLLPNTTKKLEVDTSGDSHHADLTVTISPICVNISDTNVCLLLDVLFGAVLPIQTVVSEVIQHLGSKDAGNASVRENTATNRKLTAGHDALSWRWTVRCKLEEFKILLLSSVDSSQNLEALVKQVFDAPGIGLTRGSLASSSLADIQLGSPRRFQRSDSDDSWDHQDTDPAQVDRIPVGDMTLASLSIHLVVEPGPMGQNSLQCDFSMQEASISDRISDPAEYLTQLVGLVPDAPMLNDVEHTTLFAVPRSDDANTTTVQPQLMGTCSIHQRNALNCEKDTRDGENHLDILVSSARFMLLPRTVLRLEQFGLDVYAASSRKWMQLRRDYDSLMESKPSRLGKPGFLESAIEMDDLRALDSDLRYGVPVLRSRRDSVSESLKDDMSVVRSAFMSPIQRMLSTASARDVRVPNIQPNAISEGDKESDHEMDSSESPEPGSKIVRSNSPSWKVELELAHLELWVVSTDQKADAAGCVLFSTLNFGADTSPVVHDDATTALASERLVSAFLSLANVKVQMDSPLGAFERSSATILKSANFPWILVEQFDVDSTVIVEYNCRLASNDTTIELSDEQARQSKRDDDHTFPKHINSRQFGRDIPSEWAKWFACIPSITVDEIVSRVSYRDLPLLLKIASSLSNMAKTEARLREMVESSNSADHDDIWDDFPDTPKDASKFGFFDTDGSENDLELVGKSSTQTVVDGSIHLGGLQFRFINNIVDQESPVVGIRTQAIDVAVRADSNAMVKVSSSCTVEAWYHNLRLVASEPLIEPWTAEFELSRQSHTTEEAFENDGDEEPLLEVSPWELKLSSREFLQVNLTDAFVANLTAANRAWSWVVNEGGDPREIREYSTYWIRNNTGLPMQYWDSAHRPRSLQPGREEPLRFGDPRGSNQEGQNPRGRDRHLFIAVEEEYPSDPLANTRKKWQSETPIPVDQVDSRMYALVDNEADLAATAMRKCECVIDVVMERGCKFFVVRSTLLLENKTASDLEIEIVPPQRRTGSAAWRSGSHHGHIIPIWKSVVKAASVVPVPVHLVSLGEGYVMVRPPDSNAADAGSSRSLLPKAYAKERVNLPVFDRPTPMTSGGNGGSNEFDGSECVIKFHRLFNDRPVRPFIMTSNISSSSGALYHRVLSFQPPLTIHNLTAGLLDFTISTPSEWMPMLENDSVSQGMGMGWENTQQRIREHGTINIADSLIWHMSDSDTPLELRVRMHGFEWSDPLVIDGETGSLTRIKMKDVVTDAFLYITAEVSMNAWNCREVLLYLPYWIVNLTGLKLEYEFDEERTGHEHATMLLAGQKRLDRDELLMKEMRSVKFSRREPNPLLVNAGYPGQQQGRDAVRMDTLSSESRDGRQRSKDHGDVGQRRHPCLLPSVPPVKGLLDLLPRSVDESKNLGQIEVLQACHSDYRSEKGCVRLRVTEDASVTLMDPSDSGQRKWSEPFMLDQTGTIGEIETEDYGADRKYSIGYSITPAKGQYSRTKVIMLTPRFMLVNSMGCAIQVCHSSAKVITPSAIELSNNDGQLQNGSVMPGMSTVVHLDADAFADFHWTLRFAKSRTIRCRIAEFGWTWSGAVPLVESGEFVVRVRHESTRESKLLRITLKLDSSCICATFREENTTAPPYRIENYSLETLRIHQHRVRQSEILLPHHSLDYAWDEPTEERKLVVDMLPSAAGDNSRPLRIGVFVLDKIQQYPDALSGTLGIEILADGPTRVLRFADTRLRGEQGDSRFVKQGEVPFDQEKHKGFLSRFVAAPMLHTTVQLQGVGVSVVDSLPKELVYFSVSSIEFELLMSEEDKQKGAVYAEDTGAAMSRLERESHARITAFRLQVGDVQIDNQLQVTPYPVLLRFSNPYGRGRFVDSQMVNAPALQLTLVKHDEYAGIDFVRHFSVNMLPVHVRVDGSLLYELLPLLNHGAPYGGMKKEAKRAVGVEHSGNQFRHARNQFLLQDYNSSLEVPVQILETAHKDNTTSAGPSTVPTAPSVRKPRHPRRKRSGVPSEIQRYSLAVKNSSHSKRSAHETKKLYFEEFRIGAIRATVSFSFGASAGAMVDGHMASLSSVVSDSTREGSTVPVGPLRLILNAIGTSLSKIANAPFSLKPLHIHNSFVQPDALATRLVSHYQSEALRQAYVILGSVDVLGNPMIAWRNLRGGFQDFIYEPAHGITQGPQAFAYGMGRGTLSLFRASVYTVLDFNTRILSAVSLGLSEACLKLDDYTGYPATRNIFQGVAQGISGIVVAPIHAVEVNGVRGVFPGLMAGAIGLVLKPMLGLSLATATTAATLRDVVDPNTKALLVRVRPPRHIDLRTKRLKVYSYVESLGEEIVSKIRGGRYRADGYLGHVDLKQKCLLVTKKRVLFLDVKASGQKFEVEWELLAEEVIMVDCRKTPGEQMVTIYYIEDEFKSSSGGLRQRTPGLPKGMLMKKHTVALPDTKTLFVRAMLEQQERSLLTKMNSYKTPDTAAKPPVSSVTKAATMELKSWQQHRLPASYPIFRLPSATQIPRSASNLSQVLRDEQVEDETHDLHE